MSQTAVTLEAPIALPGGLGDTGHDMYIRSYAIEGITGAFGLFVVPGTDGETQVAVPTVGGVVAGCLVHQHPLQDEAAATDFADGETVGVLAKGRVWAVAAEAMAVGDVVYVEDAGGEVRNDATAATILPGSKVEAYDADQSLVLLSLNLP